jgi:drug/metabolite transporter (DMT)-like permease
MSLARAAASDFGVRAIPLAFVVIWSSGYVVARFGLPYAPPLFFLSARYLGVIALMGTLAFFSRAPWPKTLPDAIHVAVAGLAIQAGYLGCVWCAIELGMPAGLAALIVNTQPILTAVISGAFGEQVTRRQWLGLILGFVGVLLVVSNRISTNGLSSVAIVLAVCGLFSMTLGTLYQKHFCPFIDVRTGQVIQFIAALLVTLPVAFVFEVPRIEFTANFWLAYAWSVFVLSGGGVSLFFLMIRRGRATEVTSYLYLVPPVTALMAYLMFGEIFTRAALIGLVITSLAVALVVLHAGNSERIRA